MPSLLEPDQPIDSGLLGPPPRITPPDPGNVDWADAVSALQQAIEAQRAKSAQMGLWDEQTGLPTAAGARDAAQQYAGGLLMGSTTPGEASLTPAIRHGGKVYKAAPDDVPSHIGALRSVPVDQRPSAMGDGNNRVYVTDAGKVLDRFRAAHYAWDNDLIARDAPPYARTHPELVAEWLQSYRDYMRSQ